jgi:hypothetical protein
MNRIFSNIVTLVVLVTLVTMVAPGCASTPTKDIKVDSKADPRANFGGYQTYAWLGSAAILNDPEGRWEPPAFDADAEVKFLIDRELRKRGMTENPASPDMLVAFAAGIDMAALELKAAPDSGLSELTNVPKGGLVVALIDARSGLAIWMGKAIADVRENPNTAEAGARLDYAVTQMLKQVPR